MATTSTGRALKKRLLELIAQDNILGQLDVSAGISNLTREMLIVGEWRSVQDYALIGAGRKSRDETIEMAVVIAVNRPTDTFADAEDRAVELVGILEDFLAEDPSLGVDGVQWVRISDFTITPQSMGSAAAAVADITLEARARLR